GQPGAGIGGNTVGRPPLDGGGERLGRRLLGDVEVTETLGQGRDDPGPFVTVCLGDRLARVPHLNIIPRGPPPSGVGYCASCPGQARRSKIYCRQLPSRIGGVTVSNDSGLPP